MRAARDGPIRIGVVGLGTGSLACQTEPGDTLRFYEIDPAVERIARDPERFTFLAECMPHVPVVIGDARLMLADTPDGSYDVLVVDAFSSDAIPTHLLTREAMAIYRQPGAPDGIVMMHVSNRHHVAGAGGRRRCRGQRPRSRDEGDGRFRSGETGNIVHRGRAWRTGPRDWGACRTPRLAGGEVAASPDDGSGPTIIPTSSAR